MQVLFPRCCGLDVHKRSVVACVLLTAPDGQVARHRATFGTMTADLLALEEWLARLGVTHIAIESTGIYWRPIYNLLEAEGRTILLVNPQHLKRVPGRKTDVADAEWLADLLRHGLLTASFLSSGLRASSLRPASVDHSGEPTSFSCPALPRRGITLPPKSGGRLREGDPVSR